MPSYVLPNIGASGVYTLSGPFSAALTPGVSYECCSIRTLSDIIAEGVYPFDIYYAPYNATEAQYNSDVLANVSIVGLQCDSGDFVYVPNSYIAGYPNGNGIKYTSMMIGIGLGALPNSLSLDSLRVDIAALVHDSIGVNAATNLIAISKTQLVDNAIDATITTIRKARMSNDSNASIKIANLNNQLALALQKIASLEKYILSHKTTP